MKEKKLTWPQAILFAFAFFFIGAIVGAEIDNRMFFKPCNEELNFAYESNKQQREQYRASIMKIATECKATIEGKCSTGAQIGEAIGGILKAYSLTK